MTSLRAVEPPASVDADAARWLRALGLTIRLARIRNGWSQEELGRRCGVSRVTVGSMERADHPTAVTAARQVAVGLGLSFAELVQQADVEAIKPDRRR